MKKLLDEVKDGSCNLPQDSDLTLEDELKISIYINNNKYDGQFSSHFSSVPKNSLLFIVGSTGFLEVSINQANAAKKLDFKVGDIITIKL